ncbi:MAG: cell division protein ZapA [Alphaproteobacteria bacterium]|nr:cell division protein ZapA [Alphaproteobacteria bacterium]
MSAVPIRINGKEYRVACDDGQEEHLRALSFDLDERVNQLAYQMGGNPGEVMSLLLAGLMMVDEAVENKKEIERLSKEVRALTKAAGQAKPTPDSARIAEMEGAMIETLNEIAARIERMAGQVGTR